MKLIKDHGTRRDEELVDGLQRVQICVEQVTTTSNFTGGYPY